MEKISAVKTNIDRPYTTKRYSAPLRLWHWLNAMVITLSFITVIVNSTVLSGGSGVASVQKSLSTAGVNITDNQARGVVHDLRDQIWEWHKYIGFTLAALFLFRIVLELFQVTEQKLLHKIKKAYRQFFIVKQQRELAGHEFWVKTIYAIFYLLLTITVITGFDLAFEDDFKFLRRFHFLKEIHQANMYLILAFIILHIAGVYLAERHEKDKGIVSDMIGGGAE